MAYNNIPIIVVLWEHPNFTGRRLLLPEDTPTLGTYGFNDITSAIGIHPGPNYDPKAKYMVSFYQDTDYRGAQLLLAPGAYPDLRYPYNFNDMISSVNLGQGIPNAPTIAPIHIAAELYEHANYAGRKLIILENVPNLHSYANFGDIITSVKVRQGPNYAAGNKLWLYRDTSYRGGGIDLDPGDYPNLGTSHGFNDVVSSVKIG